MVRSSKGESIMMMVGSQGEGPKKLLYIVHMH